MWAKEIDILTYSLTYLYGLNKYYRGHQISQKTLDSGVVEKILQCCNTTHSTWI
jgi:hypothetical protein